MDRPKLLLYCRFPLPGDGGVSKFCYADAEDVAGIILRFPEKDEAESIEVQARMLKRGDCLLLKNFDEALTGLFDEELAKLGFAGVLRCVNR